MSIRHTLPQLTLWKDNDVFVIEKFMKAKCFSHPQMKILNEVRMCLKISTLSDITTLHGTKFLHWALPVEPMESCSSQQYKLPTTAIPSTKHKKLWRSALRMAFARQIVNRIDIHLVTDSWLSIAQPFLRWWFSRLTQSLYERTQNRWTKWRKNPHKVDEWDK